MPGEPLNLGFVNDSFETSLINEDDVEIDAYMNGYNELTKFLDMIGAVFSFVSSDVKSKMKVMEKHREGVDKSHYDSFKKMMKHEKETKLYEKDDFVSGCRTMLRLHRGLDFIRLFLKRLADGETNVNTGTVCRASYAESLSQFHPWYIRQAATLAMHALPSRSELLKRIFGSEDNQKHALEVLPSMLEACDKVYNRVDQLYTQFEFHRLP